MEDERIKIAMVLDAIVSSLNISEFRKLQEEHESGWKEFLNGSTASQLAADKKKELAIADLVSGLDESRIKFIIKHMQ